MKVLVLDTVDPSLTDGLVQLGFHLEEDYISLKNVVASKLSNYEGLVVRSRFPLDKDFLAQGTQLKFIARVGAGMENIDVDFAQQMGIHLIKAPEGNRDAVGEHALGMLLMLFNNLKRADKEVRQGLWLREENRGLEIHSKVVGIIGYGYMGSAFAEKLQGLGCKVLAYDKYKKDFGNELVQEVSLEELQKQADIVSLHIPQSADTVHMLDEEFIDGFSKPFYLINTARGNSVNTGVLVEALKNGKISGACLDVLEYEKSSFESMFDKELPAAFQYLTQSENVILSPHVAGWSHESNKKMTQVILDKIKALKLS